MKLTETQIKKIIQEEIEMFVNEQEENEQPEADPDTKALLAKQLKDLSLEIVKMQGLDKNEIQLINQILTQGLQISKDGNARTKLIMALQKLGAEIL
jgi:hypothetical protein